MRILLLLPIFCAALAAQTVEGDVVNSVTGAPVVGARVSANPVKGGKTLIVRTDAAGHFQFPATASAISQVVIVRPGFMIAMKPCSITSKLRIEIPPAAVISGTIEDEDGFPVARAYVQAIRDQYFYGEHRQQIVALGKSDDRGSYRLSDLPGGRFWIRVASVDLEQWDSRYDAQYYPGTVKADDTNKVEVKTGEERGGVDIHLKRFEGVTISGRVVAPAGEGDLWRLTAPIVDLGGPGLWLDGRKQPDGSFTVSHVPPGDYTLRVTSGNWPLRAGDLYASQRLHVGETDQSGIVLNARHAQPVDLSGTIVTNTVRNPPPMVAEVEDERKALQYERANADGSFVIKGLMPGHYEIDAKPVPDASATSNGSVLAAGYPVTAILDGRDTLVDGFDLDGSPPGPVRIVVSSRAIDVSGKLLDASGNPSAQVALAFLSDGATGQGFAASDKDGAFRVTLKQPGDYHVYLMMDTAHWDDWDYLKAHATDFPVVKVVDGPNAPLVLRLPAK